jgi:RecB family endonuclease NucS
MAIYNLENDSLKKVDPTTFQTEGIFERKNLQAALKQQIDIIAPNSLVIAEEFSEWSDSQRRIDLLAVDNDANLVVIELSKVFKE